MKAYILHVIRVSVLCLFLGLVGGAVLSYAGTIKAAYGWLWGSAISGIYFIVLGMHGHRMTRTSPKYGRAVSWLHMTIRMFVVASLVLVSTKWSDVDIVWVVLAIIGLHPLLFLYFWYQTKRI